MAMNGLKWVDMGLALFAKIKDFFFQFLKWIFMVEGLIHFWVSNLVVFIGFKTCIFKKVTCTYMIMFKKKINEAPLTDEGIWF